jgi:O-antigen/teichoic acid export membrane protein
MLLTISRVVFPQAILTALRANKLILAVAVAEMLINIVASILLAQRFGLVGVAYGTVIAFVAEKILMTLILYCIYDIAPSRYIPFVPFTIYSVLLTLCYLISILL